MSKVVKEGTNLFRIQLDCGQSLRLANYFYEKGTVSLAGGDLNCAICFFDKAVYYDPYHQKAHAISGIVLMSLHKTKEALKCFKKALQVDSNDLNSLFNLARCYSQSNQPLLAIDYFEIAIECDPACAVAHYHLGAEYESVGIFHKAIKHFRLYILFSDIVDSNGRNSAREEIAWLSARTLHVVSGHITSNILTGLRKL